MTLMYRNYFRLLDVVCDPFGSKRLELVSVQQAKERFRWKNVEQILNAAARLRRFYGVLKNL